MRTVRTFGLGTVATTGGYEEIVVVAKNGIFSHAHYFRRYIDGDHRQLYSYTAEEVVEDVLKSCGSGGYWREKALTDLRAVGLSSSLV